MYSHEYKHIEHIVHVVMQLASVFYFCKSCISMHLCHWRKLTPDGSPVLQPGPRQPSWFKHGDVQFVGWMLSCLILLDVV